MSRVEGVMIAWVVFIGGALILLATLATGPVDGGTLLGLCIVITGLVALMDVHTRDTRGGVR